MPLPSLGRLSSRTNLKAVNPGKHRNSAAKEAETAVEDHELTSYLAALAPDENESTGSGKRFGDAQVYQLRMNQIAGEQLKEVAAQRGISPQALAVEWVLERLSWESQAASDQRRPAAPRPQAQAPMPQRPRRPQPVDDNETTDQHSFGQQWDWPTAASR